jgi:hypothetical protein
MEVKNSAPVVSTFSLCPRAGRLGHPTANRPRLVNASYSWCDNLQIYPIAGILHPCLGLCLARVFPSYRCLAWKRSRQTYSQQWYSGAGISWRSGATVPSCAAPASAKVCSTRTMNRLLGTSSSVRVSSGSSNWLLSRRLISAYELYD